MTDRDFDIDPFLARPLTARIATNGPTIRPAWFLWEDNAFWTITGPWSVLPKRVRTDPVIAMVVDECDLATGTVRQVIARGQAEILPFDVPRGYRKLARYLGENVSQWDQRFRRLTEDPTDIAWLRLSPTSITAKDLSYEVQPPR
ncbi:pyridoxamine 5'-phosphate oxidase family protein [Tamaricihabitans halophyticus]|uniref:pyridoxamine 5'-phosphate oxidase family protein n=1 Tax=Tamaricihabitans halophyticus TaxID=1262583 RepID=UPI00104DEB39|nr:pyridoxamine 5'-phosphate oxidase family protein [Tamaricihabitans halophyticus]